jgi:hypothetical protein
MSGRIFPLLLVVGLATGTPAKAKDPFVGKWKVNPSKSKLNDEMKVEVAGANRYRISFGPVQVDTVVADGSDQPALSGTTLSVSVKGRNSWDVIRKLKGRTLLTAHWTLSEDGRTLHDAFTQYLPNGSSYCALYFPNGATLFMPLVYERTAGTSGFLGTWDSETQKVDPKTELQIQPDEGDGLSFTTGPDATTAKRMKFDGTDHPDLDPNGRDNGTTYSARRVNERSLEITEKFQGKVTGTRQIELSSDLKTLTVTVLSVGRSRPVSSVVYDRE